MKKPYITEENRRFAIKYDTLFGAGMLLDLRLKKLYRSIYRERYQALGLVFFVIFIAIILKVVL
jgi:hypothetical protein